MEINPVTIFNYLQMMKDRETYAFEDATVFNKYLELFAQATMEIQEIFRELMQERSIDTAVGAQLDIIGNIVGQPRELIDTDLIPYFGYQGATNAQSYGDTDNASLGGYYWDINQPLAGSVLLNDDQYRLFIKAKILKNITRATPEDVISFITFVFGATRVQITSDEGAEQALILVSEDMDQFEIALLRYFTDGRYRSYFIPKSLGVGYQVGGIPTGAFFSYLGVAGASGYGDLQGGIVVGGGKYASIY